MDTAIKAARFAMSVSVALLILPAGWMCWRVARTADALTADAQAAPRLQQKQLDQITQKLLATADGFQQITVKLNNSIDKIKVVEVGDLAQIHGAIHEARQALKETRSALYQINFKMVPQVMDSIKKNDDNLAKLTDQTTDSIKTFSEGMGKVTANGAQLIADADRLVNDPNLPLALASFARTTQHAENITANFDDVSLKARLTADHYYNVIMAPKTLAQKIWAPIDQHLTWLAGGIVAAH